MSSITRRVLSGTLPSIILCLVLFSGAGAAEQSTLFERSGIHYPGGFDLNTVGTVTGRVISLDRPNSSGPVIVNIQSTWEKYAVVTCPPWYWDELKITLPAEEDIKVTGSKSLGKDGILYVIAQDIALPAQGRTISLRNKTGNPLWGRQNGNGSRHQGKNSRTSHK
ncbi:MAG TPA: hypothetical protein VHO84_06415 [Syntrophorhabdaceae bacterium]|nr:hypothetical protein [Syntrophorhabdaceae bacterium]